MLKILASILTLLSLSLGAETPKEAFELVKKNQAVMIDVREEAEIKEGMIEKAIWFPLSKITDDKNWLAEFKALSKDKKIFLYCRSGNRSGKVKDILAKEKISAENIGGIMTLKDELPVRKPE